MCQKVTRDITWKEKDVQQVTGLRVRTAGAGAGYSRDRPTEEVTPGQTLRTEPRSFLGKECSGQLDQLAQSSPGDCMAHVGNRKAATWLQLRAEAGGLQEVTEGPIVWPQKTR